MTEMADNLAHDLKIRCGLCYGAAMNIEFQAVCTLTAERVDELGYGLGDQHTREAMVDLGVGRRHYKIVSMEHAADNHRHIVIRWKLA